MDATIFRMLTITLILAMLSAGNCPAQDSTKVTKQIHPFLMARCQAGYLIQTDDFVEGKNQTMKPIEYFVAGRVQVGWQSDGSQGWMQTYRFPSCGWGISGSNHFNEEELGTPVALYGSLA